MRLPARSPFQERVLDSVLREMRTVQRPLGRDADL